MPVCWPKSEPQFLPSLYNILLAQVKEISRSFGGVEDIE